MIQKEATTLGLNLLKDSPLSEESKSLAESYLPYIVQRYYLAGIEFVPAKPTLKLGDTISQEELGQMLESGVIY
jgi:hypothetical protein